METLVSCALKRWSPGIGDPTVTGWMTVVVHALTACLAVAVVMRAPFPLVSGRRERRFWAMIAVTLAFLAVNKQLDLQSFCTAVGRCLAKAQGWYEERRSFQRDVFLMLLACGLVGLAALSVLMRGTLARNGLAVLGLCVLTGFVVVRAVGFHHMDGLIRQTVLSVRVNAVFEIGGALLVAVAALLLLLLRAGRAAR